MDFKGILDRGFTNIFGTPITRNKDCRSTDMSDGCCQHEVPRLVPISTTNVVSGFLSINLELLMSGNIKSLRSTAYSHQAGHCYYCNMPMWTTNPQEISSKYGIKQKQAKLFQCTAEHLQARKDGGGNSKSNIVAACLFCNQLRHRLKNPPEPEKYKEWVQRRLKQKKLPKPMINSNGKDEKR